MIVNLLLISLAIQFFLFIPAFKFKTDKLTDLSYSLTFVLLTLIAFLQSDMVYPKLLLLIMISVWGIRLGVYLFIRINKTKKDDRFDEIRPDFVKFLSFWILQGVSVFVILLPTLFYFQTETNFRHFSFWGFGIWFIGLLIEGLADYQKFSFKNDPRNKDRWIDIGLWKYSRHPNYLGEILCWFGIYLYVYSSLPNTYKVVGLLSPLFITALLLFVSGIPKLEEKADKKWGSDKRYQRYKKKTARLIPFVY